MFLSWSEHKKEKPLPAGGKSSKRPEDRGIMEVNKMTAEL